MTEEVGGGGGREKRRKRKEKGGRGDLEVMTKLSSEAVSKELIAA